MLPGRSFNGSISFEFANLTAPGQGHNAQDWTVYCLSLIPERVNSVDGLSVYETHSLFDQFCSQTVCPKLSLFGFTNAESGNPLASCDHHCFIRLQNRLFTFSNIQN